MLHRLWLLVLAALLVAGCGVRTSKPFTAKGSAACLSKHGFTGLSTKISAVGFIAGFADKGGIRARSATGNVVTIAFAADADSAPSTAQAFRLRAPKSLRPHMSDIMETDRNAVLVWTVTPNPDEDDAARRCLAP